MILWPRQGHHLRHAAGRGDTQRVDAPAGRAVQMAHVQHWAGPSHLPSPQHARPRTQTAERLQDLSARPAKEPGPGSERPDPRPPGNSQTTEECKVKTLAVAEGPPPWPPPHLAGPPVSVASITWSLSMRTCATPVLKEKVPQHLPVPRPGARAAP